MKRTTSFLFLAALSGAAWAQDAGSVSEPQPERIQAEFSDVYEASIEIDSGLDSHPAIQTVVRNDELGVLADFAAQAVEDHARWMADAPEWSWNGYFQDVTIEIAFANPDVISLVRRASYYTGGAHPNQAVDAVVTRADELAPITLSEILNDTAIDGPAMTALFYALYRELMAIKRDRLGEGFDERVERETWLSSLAAEPGAFPDFSLLPNESGEAAAGLVFHFEPYEIGSYAEGSYDVPVPLAAFDSYLSESWRSVFAGAPARTILTQPGDELEPETVSEPGND
ncbi:DUF3298 domain-containing protein [Hyphobacterium sp.]|uniref:DUF3298 and DUF4163 domain-containing protein n=1 Tax=Hyphobacterium sp. TaxID=2004662 RepID=UPI003BAB9281